MGMGVGDNGSAMSDINVTPLVDVMLVLLIIFMITAPMMNQTQGVEIDLPKETAQPITANAEDQLILSIDRELNYFINESKFNAEEMPKKLRAIADANPDKPVFIQADGDVPYREVARLLAAAKRAGMPRVGMVFEPSQLEDDGDTK